MTTGSPLIEAAPGVIRAASNIPENSVPGNPEVPTAEGVLFGDIVKAYLTLMKPKVIVLLEIPTLAAMLIAQPELPAWWLVVVTLLAGA
ncbi:MAG: hypothetical protein EBU40_16725, partial [Proteobacteria bacterium]|nr:hypothetical protein [Pseudomonadota bacterium]